MNIQKFDQFVANGIFFLIALGLIFFGGIRAVTLEGEPKEINFLVSSMTTYLGVIVLGKVFLDDDQLQSYLKETLLLGSFAVLGFLAHFYFDSDLLGAGLLVMGAVYFAASIFAVGYLVSENLKSQKP